MARNDPSCKWNSHALSFSETIFRTTTTCNHWSTNQPKRVRLRLRFWTVTRRFHRTLPLGQQVGGYGASLSAHGCLCPQVSVGCQLFSVTEVGPSLLGIKFEWFQEVMLGLWIVADGAPLD